MSIATHKVEYPKSLSEDAGRTSTSFDSAKEAQDFAAFLVAKNVPDVITYTRRIAVGEWEHSPHK